MHFRTVDTLFVCLLWLSNVLQDQYAYQSTWEQAVNTACQRFYWWTEQHTASDRGEVRSDPITITDQSPNTEKLQQVEQPHHQRCVRHGVKVLPMFPVAIPIPVEFNSIHLFIHSDMTCSHPVICGCEAKTMQYYMQGMHVWM